MAAEIKAYVKPVRLYRYRSVAERKMDREIRAIEEGYIYCADYTDLNDPMEGVFTSSRLLRQSKSYKTVTRAIAQKKTEIGISSFSEVYDHALMWAHYADQFRGICIAYQFSNLLEHLADRVEFVRMFYHERVPTVGRTHTPTDELAKRVLSHKNHRWLYEREWRMFGPKGKAHYTKPGCVPLVYLGFRIEPKCRLEIERRLHRLEVKTMSMSIDSYSMSFSSKRS